MRMKQKNSKWMPNLFHFKSLALALALVLSIFTSSLLASQSSNPQDIRLAPGDDKTGYEQQNYTTNSLSLEQRNGVSADLLSIAKANQLGLPVLSEEVTQGLTSSIIQLGRKLFFDRRLSLNKTMSCAMCHIPEQGFSNNELARPIGFEGRALKRNAPTILNVAYVDRLFADARESSLEQQVWSPLLASNEMNNPSIGYVIDTINDSDDYSQVFENAFGEPANMLNIGVALAQYERSLISGNSRFDRWLFAKETKALNANEIAGYYLFIGKAGCIACHHIKQSEKTALFTDNLLHNTGVGYRDSMLSPASTVSVQIAPGITTKLDQKIINSIGSEKPNDLGRYEVTLDPNDRWKYRTPSLRNIALSAPYMHNGKFLSLQDVIVFYNQGGEPNPLLSPLIRPLNLSKSEQANLAAFLRSLTGSNLKTLIADAFAAPIGDAGSNAGVKTDEQLESLQK